jgi:hypothetical protein
MNLAFRLLFLLPGTALALDLTPNPGFKELEGVRIPQIQFAHGEQSVTWRPPADWRMTYEDGRLLFLPKDRTHASFELCVVRRAPRDTEVLTDAKKLQAYAAAFLPKSATDIVYKQGNQGPFTINAIPALEFLLDFQEPGHPSQASFSVVDLNERERLIVVITAQPKDFEEVRATAIQSMFSWQVD